jgi:uncharacterized damage-inducible protein DinB
MIDPGAMRELYRYDRWANDRAFAAASPLAQEDFARELPGSHASVRATLTHIVSAEWLYLRRWQGESPQHVFEAREFHSQRELEARWRQVAAEREAFLESLTAERLLASVRYLNLQGESWEYPLWRQMYHVVNHSSYHRGQLATLLRGIGAMPLATDFLVFHDHVQPSAAESSRPTA